ncbi:MAG TPA: phosphoribosyltransferase family protein [Kiritimatiellia bacterium]|nr:phosphoribosyltransferase family protein [Kiritimatiellia bacterium]
MWGWLASRGRRFADRAAAGRALAARLDRYVARRDSLVLALPRGGVPVAFEVARALGAPLDLILVRKLGVPGEEELALGALAEGGLRVLNDDVVAAAGVGLATIERIAARAEAEIARQARAYRGGRTPPALRDRTVILVDDGLATGATMRAAVAAARAQAAARVIVAAPVAAPETVGLLAPTVDEVVACERPDALGAIGLWYDDFRPVGDDEVRELLRQTAELRAEGGG